MPMKLKSLSSYQSGFALLKAVTIVSIALAVIVPAGMYVYMIEKLSEIKSTIYVLDKNAHISDASARYENEVRIYEYEDIVKDVFSWWYELDERSYSRNIDKALLIFDEIGKSLKDEYDAQGLLTALKEKNLYTTVQIKEPLNINMDTYPVTGTIQGVQKWTWGENVIDVEISVDFTLRDVQRGKGNPHGVKITKWDVQRSELTR